MDKTIYIIADSHLGTTEGDIDLMIRFIRSLEAPRSVLLFLGDLFHVWVGLTRYHTPEIKRLFKELDSYRSKGGIARLVAGNRDTLLPDVPEGGNNKGLPFDSISREYLLFKQGGKVVAAFHGDTVNQKDTRYLKWRRFIRHPLLESFFKLLPSAIVNRLTLKLERELKQTNRSFRRHFPETEWRMFSKRCEKELSPDLLVIGHFHPPTPIITKSGSMTGIVVPDWQEHQLYMRVAPDFSYRFQNFA
jgi:UDP-2,3-diacylglucosamine hydrolase